LFGFEFGYDEVTTAFQPRVVLRENLVQSVSTRGEPEDGADRPRLAGEVRARPVLVIFGGEDVREIAHGPGRTGFAGLAAGGKEVVAVRLAEQPQRGAAGCARLDGREDSPPAFVRQFDGTRLLLGSHHFVGVRDDHEQIAGVGARAHDADQSRSRFHRRRRSSALAGKLFGAGQRPSGKEDVKCFLVHCVARSASVEQWA